MDITLTIAILGATISAVGWVANYILSTAADKRRQSQKSQLRFTKQQLEELYGPLVFLVLEGDRSFHDLLALLGRRYVFDSDDHISGEDLKIWLFWVENDILPRHDRIINILSNKTQLIEGKVVPASFIAYLNHASSWKINHERWQKLGIPYSWHSKVNFPIEFNKDVLSTFEVLKLRQSTLQGKNI